MPSSIPINPFSPRQFLKARRPEKFADSVTESGAALDRSMLEYHLDTLTSRNQETDFEHFARRLAEYEVCPNLLPHTGPTGGGDSKVDSETYPVADALSLTWCSGIGREASQERWAFAFSAKKDWRDKLQSDIAKIAATGRKYKKVFFVTNQFIRDKVRAQVEDKLRKKHRFDVRIFDRSWILDRVFKNGHQALAVQELKLSISLRPKVRKGPLDLQKQTDLEDLELRIKQVSTEGRLNFQFVADCIEAAKVARSLELPRAEVEGRFLRAQRAAQEHGSQHQQLLVAYDFASTAYWWFEDFKQFALIYEEAEKLAKGTLNAYELELLSNLWFSLCGAVKHGSLQKDAAKFENRTRTLKAELDRLSKEQDRPSGALQAKTLRLLLELMLCLPHVDQVLRQLESVVRQCKGLIGFPLEPLVRFLTEIGDVLGDRSAYARLFETITETTRKRSGEVAVARMLLQRGAQQLDAERPYDAIRTLGRSLGSLYKHESREAVVQALYICANAYEKVGLLWAARGTALTAASIAAHEFWTYSEVTPLQAACFNRMKWFELRLGRLPHALAWHEVDRAVEAVLASQGYQGKGPAAWEMEFDVITGILLLRTDLWQIRQLSRMPDTLDGLGLSMSSIALRYALGHEDDLPDDLKNDPAGTEGIRKFFALWRDQPAAEDLPTSPFLYETRKVEMKSSVLGCKISVECDNTQGSIQLAESILSALESLLATGMRHDVFAQEPVLTINVRASDFATEPFGFELKDRGGRPHVDVSLRAAPGGRMTKDAQKQTKDKLFQLLAHVVGRVFLIQNTQKLLRNLFVDELALQRSVEFASSLAVSATVLGESPKTNIGAWSHEKARNYALKRLEEWDSTDRRSKPASNTPEIVTEPEPGQGSPQSWLTEAETLKHTDMETVSLIRQKLWDRASWSGTGYFLSPRDSEIPILGLLFQNSRAAQEIFEDWRKELGAEDKEERLRLSIIRGINANNPFAYRVLIGTDPRPESFRQGVRYLMISRMNTMNSASNVHLDSFLNSYKKVGAYTLAHAILPDPSSEPTLVTKDAIIKRQLNVRQAWEIGRDDPDSMGIRTDDQPIIAAGEQNTPVLELLAWKRTLRSRA